MKDDPRVIFSHDMCEKDFATILQKTFQEFQIDICSHTATSPGRTMLMLVVIIQ